VAFAFDRLEGGDWDVVTSIWSIDAASPPPPPPGPTEGDDTLTAASGGSVIDGLGGNDHLIGLSGNDTFDGSAGNDRLEGAGGKDILRGGAGLDVLIGGSGADQLTGGTEADSFVFKAFAESPAGSGRDVIQDFSHADGDLIDLSAIDANTKVSGLQHFHFVDGDLTQTFASYHKTHAKGQWAGVLRVTADGLVQGDVNADGKADFEIMVHGDHLTKADFLV
jgi:Ca2+-binding RTX toxin-like protein